MISLAEAPGYPRGRGEVTEGASLKDGLREITSNREIRNDEDSIDGVLQLFSETAVKQTY